MDETAADRLAIAAEQLDHTTGTLRGHGITTADLKQVATYLSALTIHAYQVTALALRAVENADPADPVLYAPHGTDVQTCLGHAASLFDAAMHFADEAERAAHQIDPES